MNILCIGDPHGNLAKVKKMPLRKADAIILTGDLGDATLTRNMAFDNLRRRVTGLPLKQYTNRQHQRAYLREYTTGLKLVKYLAKHAPVYIIYGNGELSNAETRAMSKQLKLPLPSITQALKAIPGVHLFNNKKIRMGESVVAGLPFFSEHDEREAKRAASNLNKFGKIDILVCHQPPYGVLDALRNRNLPRAWQGKKLGSKVIAQYIRRYKPKLVLCGHIHEGKGTAKIGKTIVHNLGECHHKLLKL